MDIEKAWHEALKRTEIVRSRIQILMTTSETRVPYVLLSESTINDGDTVVRKGEITIDKPSLILPPNNPQFNGFEFDKNSFEENTLINFLIVRGVNIPSFRYDNNNSSLDVYEGKLSKAVKEYDEGFKKEENVTTGLIVGPGDYWQFSLLIFICSQITKNIDLDIKKLLAEYKDNNG